MLAAGIRRKAEGLKSSLERAKSGRAGCGVCGLAIAKDTVRVVEKKYDDRNEHLTKTFSHVACCVKARRERARDAIAAVETPDALAAVAIEEVAQIDAALAEQIREARARRGAIVVVEEDPQTLALLAELEAAPKDRGLYAVLADHLQQRGDVRGELIALDLAASIEEPALVRRRELTAALSPKLGSLDRATWGIGFLRKLEISAGQDGLEKLTSVLSHASCRLLEVVSINRHWRPTPVLLPRGLVPRSVRRLEVFGGIAKGSDLSELPHLEQLLLEQPMPGTFACVPPVARLEVRYGIGSILDELGPCVHALRELVFEFTPLHTRDVMSLERVLAGKRLERLAILRSDLTSDDAPRLAQLCETLEFDGQAPAVPTTILIEHANKPEWGRGTIVREFDGKVEVEFPGVGKKLFKADAPFLKRSP